MRILQTMISIKATLTPMVILVLMISLSSCKINKEVDFDQTVMDGRSPAFSVETKEKAIAACSLMKQKELEKGWITLLTFARLVKCLVQ